MWEELFQNWRDYMDGVELDLTKLAEEAFKALQHELQVPHDDPEGLPDLYLEVSMDTVEKFFRDPDCPMQ